MVFIALKAEVGKLDINKLVNVPTIFNNLKIKVDDLDVDNMESLPVELEKKSVVVSKDVVQKTVYSKWNMTMIRRMQFLVHLFQFQ